MGVAAQRPQALRGRELEETFRNLDVMRIGRELDADLQLPSTRRRQSLKRLPGRCSDASLITGDGRLRRVGLSRQGALGKPRCKPEFADDRGYRIH